MCTNPDLNSIRECNEGHPVLILPAHRRRRHRLLLVPADRRRRRDTAALPALRCHRDGGGPVGGAGGRGRARPALPAADDDEAGGGEDGDEGAARADGDQDGDEGHVGLFVGRPPRLVQVLPVNKGICTVRTLMISMVYF